MVRRMVRQDSAGFDKCDRVPQFDDRLSGLAGLPAGRRRAIELSGSWSSPVDSLSLLLVMDAETTVLDGKAFSNFLARRAQGCRLPGLGQLASTRFHCSPLEFMATATTA